MTLETRRFVAESLAIILQSVFWAVVLGPIFGIVGIVYVWMSDSMFISGWFIIITIFVMALLYALLALGVRALVKRVLEMRFLATLSTSGILGLFGYGLWKIAPLLLEGDAGIILAGYSGTFFIYSLLAMVLAITRTKVNV